MRKFFKPFRKSDFKSIKNIEDILSMHPRRFEWFCKYLLPYFGYKKPYVTRKHGTYESDGGVDIRAKLNGEVVLVQCKRLITGRGGYVPIEVIRELRGCMNDDIKHGVVMATLPYGRQAKAEAKKYHVELIGIEEIKAKMSSINPDFEV